MNSTPAPKLRRIPIRLLAIPVALIALLLLLALLRPGAAAPAPAFHGTPYDPPEAAPTFQLTDHTGRAAGLGDHQGDVVLLFFGFTHCPDVCPLTLSKLSRVLNEMGSRADEVQILLVSVDPENDTPEALARYVEQFPAPVRGLTGDPDTLEHLRTALGVFSGPTGEHGAGHTALAHTDAIFGIDRQGQIRVLMHPDAPDEELRDDIRTLLSL